MIVKVIRSDIVKFSITEIDTTIHPQNLRRSPIPDAKPLTNKPHADQQTRLHKLPLLLLMLFLRKLP
jgi:hypothetical protein